MNMERDKFLAEAMGECWHESNWGQTNCKHCGRTNDPRYFDFNAQNSSFSTWEGFGKLWEWAQKQEWWTYIGFIGNYTEQNTSVEFLHKDCIINPDRFADAVYDYLKGYECWLDTGTKQ